MIIYDLACACGGLFEGWFNGRLDFENQREAGLLACPRCGGSNIRKILSPVYHSSSSVPDRTGLNNHQDEAGLNNEGKDRTEAEAALSALRVLQRFVEKNFENVGCKLAEESLKIRYGVAEARNIRGVATPEEEKTLKSEGIELLKIPMPLPEDDKIN